MTTPVRVLHIIDDLGGGGAQLVLWDIIRLSDPAEVQHLVFSLTTERGDFVYANRLAAAGVYRSTPVATVARRILEPVWRTTVRPTAAVARPSTASKLIASTWSGATSARNAARLALNVARFRPHIIQSHLMRSLPWALTLRKVYRRPVVHIVPCLLAQMHDIGADWLAHLYSERHPEIDVFFTGVSISELRSVGIPEQKIRPIFKAPGDFAAMVAATAQRDEYRHAVRAEIGGDPGCPVILSAGRLHRSKGHDYALAAMPAVLRAYPDAHWIVLGAGEEHSALAAQARALGIDSHVHLLGFRDDLYRYYAAADVFLRTNILEGESGCSCLAMAAGLPVVGFDSGRENDLLPPVGHGVVVPNLDSVAMARGTLDILASADRGRALGERGASYAKDHLDITPFVRTLVDLYRELRRNHA